MTTRKKLIEVALPLEAINKAAAREKSIRQGHPSTLHLWWARRPLAAARAVIFAQMVDDPSAWPDLFPTEKAQEKERNRLFGVIEELVKWESTTNERVLNLARNEIWQSWLRNCADNADHEQAKELFSPNTLPPFHDPFAGGGALPLEAQRLGLESYASDLNPVAVLINKAMIEIPPKFANMPPVNPEWQSVSAEQKELRQWKGAQGLADDVRYYGRWMRDEAAKRIGHLYPKVEITEEMAVERSDLKPYVGRKLTVIAWLWARTVKSPNPAFASIDVPLVSTFLLGTKPGKEVFVEPQIGNDGYRFVVKLGVAPDPELARDGTKLGRGANFRCVMSGSPIAPDYVYTEARSQRMGTRLMTVVAEGDRGRVYLSPTTDMQQMADEVTATWKPDVPMPDNPRWFSPPLYGLATFGDLFTNRQLEALTTLSSLADEAATKAKLDASHLDEQDRKEFSAAIATYLSLAVGRVSDYCSSICTWANNPQMEIVRGTFSRQALQMTWDFAEPNLFGPSTGSFEILIDAMVKAIERLPGAGFGKAWQNNAEDESGAPVQAVISTDPPYYDNIGYADLSDFFYVWIRHALCRYFPDLLSTVAVPKAEELVATPYRHGGKERAESFFLEGMGKVMKRLAAQSHPAFPVTIYYAFKQSETNEVDGTSNTGWATFLDAVVRAGFEISGTWPIRTERRGRSIGNGTNALASSIVLVCRSRSLDAESASRREFLNALRAELPEALTHLQHGNIAPVDLAQAALGPGMSVYSRYREVVDASGAALSVGEALALINQTLDEILAQQDNDFDADTRWALAWSEQFGFTEGEFGVADVLARAKNTSVAGMVEAKVILSKAGKVRLLKPEELAPDWNPETDSRRTEWEVVHQLIRVLSKGGETDAARLLAKLGSRADTARELAYRLYVLCERKRWAQDALTYNSLVQSWPEIQRLASEREVLSAPAQQSTMFSQS